MEVRVKILMNSKEINEALKRNETKMNQRIHNETKKVKDRIEILPDEVVPERDIQEVPMLLDASKIDLVTIGSEGMLEILFLGKKFDIIYDENIYNQIKTNFESREKLALK